MESSNKDKNKLSVPLSYAKNLNKVKKDPAKK
jgi:hypothetical protein